MTTEINIQYVSKEHAAAMLQTSYKTVERLLSSGDLPFIKDGRFVRIDVADVNSYMQRKKTKNSY